jgi:hypothetical protein
MDIFLDMNLPSHIKIPLAHSNECNFVPTESEPEWEELEYNYRLQMCDTVFYAVENDKVVAHLGIYDGTVKGVYVSPDCNGKGITYLLYKEAFNIFPVLNSDDAREPAATHIWERLMEMYPGNITYNKKTDQYTYQSDEWLNR